MATGRWVDAEVQYASPRGTDPRNTCHSVGAGSRIDAILCSSVFASSLHGVDLVMDTGIPTHLPVRASFHVDVLDMCRYRAVIPAEFPLEAA
eukprot:6826541-Karenia_brevis.AAC.1